MTGIPSIPRATYRVQFNAGFRFEDARRIVPYLTRLGVTHLYASPYLKARTGSSHGYDIVDHNAFNPEIGSEAEFDRFSDALGEAGMGQILDFVPNHMGIGRDDNGWWQDVLEWGEDSPYASYFDIDWHSVKPELRGKVLVPVLGDHYGRVLEAGELKLGFDATDGMFSVWYYEHRFPIRPGEYPRILRAVENTFARLAANDSGTVVELEDLNIGFRDVGDWSPVHRGADGRHAVAAALKRQLADLVQRNAAVADVIDTVLERINAAVGDPERLSWMHDLLEAQHYRLAYWRVAAEEINYRRFFQINELAGIRVELPEVFEATHQLVLKLIREDRLHGLRLDHIDGLFDPKAYLERLQLQACRARGGANGHADDKAAASAAESTRATTTSARGNGNGNGAHAEAGPSFYLLVEKILAPHERLREDWPVAGTTGYDFLNRVNGLFVDPHNEPALQRAYERFIGAPVDFEEIAYRSKQEVMDFELASELRVLANNYDRLTEMSWLTRDYTLVGLRLALRELVACFPVYRTYADADGVTAQDRRDLDWAVAHARRRSVSGDKTVFDFLHAALSTDLAQGPSLYNRREVRRLAMKVQQYTGPVAAKGIEDTAFYRYNRLISLNEVGGVPTRFGTSVAAFHRTNQESARRWPTGMLATATHDTKRGEDARVRIDALSEMPLAWSRRARRWAALNQRNKTVVGEVPAPSANDEYLYYQALVGAWPAEFHGADTLDPAVIADFRARMQQFMIKAVREAKTHSSWINPGSDYEDALNRFVERSLEAERPNPFLTDFRGFHRSIAVTGMINALSQLVLKLTAPGVPDIYQGCELWEFSLVDPDNRRPVDFADRAARLSRIEENWAQQQGALASDLLANWTDGQVKLFVIWRLLGLRHDCEAVFADGAYTPVAVDGERAEHVCAFLREDVDTRVLVLVPRLVGRFVEDSDGWPAHGAVWGDTALHIPVQIPGALDENPQADAGPGERRWVDLFTGRTIDERAGEGEGSWVSVADLLDSFPVAVLVGSAPAEN